MRKSLRAVLVLFLVLVPLRLQAAPNPPATAPTPPVAITDFQYADNMIPNKQALDRVQGRMVIKNVTTSDLHNVLLRVHLQDGYEEDLAVLPKEVGTLGPGRSFTFAWTWDNYFSFFLSPLAEVTCDSPTAPTGKPIRVTLRATPPAEAPANKAELRSYTTVQTKDNLDFERWQAPESPGTPPGFNQPLPPASSPPGF